MVRKAKICNECQYAAHMHFLDQAFPTEKNKFCLLFRFKQCPVRWKTSRISKSVKIPVWKQPNFKIFKKAKFLTLLLEYTILDVVLYQVQGRIFIFGALGYFKLGTPYESLRRLVLYKSALHVLTTFTEQVVLIHKPITLFWIPSISGTRNVSASLHPPNWGSRCHRDPKFRA